MSRPQTNSAPHLVQRDGQGAVNIIYVRAPLKRRKILPVVIDLKLLLSVILVGMTAFAGCQQSQTQESHTDATTNEPSVTPTKAQSKALAAKDALYARLSGRLAEVMQAESPAAAIEVCSREAAEIAKTVGKEQGVTIGRTSIKLRNPENAPPDWVQPFVQRQTGEPQFVDLPDGQTGALLPIKLQSKCLACHGTADTISADVKTKLEKLYPNDQATGFSEGDLRGWFWVVVPAEAKANDSAAQNASGDEEHAAQDHGPGKGRGRGVGRGRGMTGRGRGAEMREDMTTLHAMFDDREKINRTVKNLPNGAEAITESDDEDIAALIQKHVPAMETRVHENEPLPPMTFHPIFVELIKHADDYTSILENQEPASTNK